MPHTVEDTSLVVIPYTFLKGKEEVGRFEFIDQLRGDLLAGTPTVEEMLGGAPVASGTDGTRLTIGAATRNPAAYTPVGADYTVQADQAVFAPITVNKGSRELVVVRVTCDTTDADRNVVQDFGFWTKD